MSHSATNELKMKSSHKKYYSDLEKWLQDAYLWQGVCASYPYFLMCNQYMSQMGNVPQVPRPPNVYVSNGNRFVNLRCKVPSFWKRMLAELIDLIILSVIKCFITWVAVDCFQLFELNFETIKIDMTKYEFKMSKGMTVGILSVEILYKILVCVYETYWLMGPFDRRPGGATPGKLFMGLRVLRINAVSHASENNNLVVIYAGSNIGFRLSLIRSFTKNIFVTMLVPFFTSTFYYSFNRVGYDMICQTIVVEDPLIPILIRQQD